MLRLNISLRLILNALWAIWVCAPLWLSPAWACPSCLTGAGGTKAPASCSDSNATAWVNAVVAASSTVSAAQQTRVCNLIVAMKGHSTWSKLDRMWLYASENATQAQIDIVNLVSHTVSGAPTFTASQGYTGNGTDFINTNFAPSTNGVNFVAASQSLGVYIRNNRVASANVTQLGVLDASSANQTTMQMNAFSSNWIGTLNVAQITVGSATTAQGFYVMSTATGQTATLYRNGSSIGTDGTGGGSLATNKLYALALDNNGAASQISSDQVAIVFMGANFTSSDVTNLSTDINGGYMTSLGTNVY